MDEPSAKHLLVIKGYMERKLSAKQAYKQVFKCRASTAYQKGSKLIKRWKSFILTQYDPKLVRERARQGKKVGTRTDHFEEVLGDLRLNYDLAICGDEPDLTEANRAAEAKAKLCGLYDDKNKSNEPARVFMGMQVFPPKDTDVP